AINKAGDTMTGSLIANGGISLTADVEINFNRNTDYFKIGFKNTADSDTDSYGYVKIGDNGNEYFKIQGVNGSTTSDWMSVKSTGVSASKFIGALQGNSDSSTKLATARGLKIGNISKNFDGTSDIAWSLADIGAVNKNGDIMSGLLQFTTAATIGAGTIPSQIGYGFFSSYGPLKLLANTDNSATDEPVLIASSKGTTPTANDGLVVGKDYLRWLGNNVYHAGYKPNASDIKAKDFRKVGAITLTGEAPTAGGTNMFTITIPQPAASGILLTFELYLGGSWSHTNMSGYEGYVISCLASGASPALQAKKITPMLNSTHGKYFTFSELRRDDGGIHFDVHYNGNNNTIEVFTSTLREDSNTDVYKGINAHNVRRGSAGTRYDAYHTHNKPSAADIGAVNKSGDTMSGKLVVSANGSQFGVSANGATGNTSVTNLMTNFIEVVSDVNANHTSSSGIVFHNRSTSTNALYYKNDSTNGGYFNFKSDDSSWNVRVDGNIVYHQGFKPTPADIGALSLSGGTMKSAIQMGANNVNFQADDSGDIAFLNADGARKALVYTTGKTEGLVVLTGASGSVEMRAGGNLTASGNITAYSDIKLKKDLEIIPDALDKISKLNGYTYTRKDTGERHTGVIAQEVQKVLPEVISVSKPDKYSKEKTDTLTVAYGNMIGLLIEGIKELKSENKILSERLVKLEAM
ncbi:MAG: tail fiber domain-containing protein, partial [Mycoplasma sp.]